MVRKLHHHKVGHIKTVNSVRLRKFSMFEKQYFNDFCDPISSMLGAELAYDPKIKFVTLLKYYNFVLGYTSMQRFQKCNSTLVKHTT